MKHEIGGLVARTIMVRNAYKTLLTKLEREKRPPETPTRRWQDNIKTEITEISLKCELNSCGSV